jgi:hypothetical protein
MLLSAIVFAQAGGGSEELDFAALKAHPSLESARQFLNDYPMGKYSREARALLDRLADDAAWKMAAEQDTREVYEGYLALYPGGRFATEARRRIQLLATQPSSTNHTDTMLAGRPEMGRNWSRYGNARYGYWIDIPPGFSTVSESSNGDGGVSRSGDGKAELRIWGGYRTEGDFEHEIGWRIDQDRLDGWTVSYQRRNARWASWSGLQRGRIFYERAIPVCGDGVSYFRLEYGKDQRKTFDPLVNRLVTSLRSSKC